MRFSPRFLALSTAVMAVFVTSCDSPTKPATEGTLVPQIVWVRDTLGLFRAVQPLDNIRASVYGPNNPALLADSKNLDQPDGSGNWKGTFGELAPGAYTVVIEGLVGTSVQHYGTVSNVPVIAGKQEPRAIPVANVVPVLPALSATTLAFTASITFPAIANAESYNVDVSQSPAFAPPVYSFTSATPTVLANLNATGTWYYRGRPKMPSIPVTSIIFSDAQNFIVNASPGGRTAGTANTTTPVIGTPGTILNQNLPTTTSEDWFTLPNLRTGDSLFLDAVAAGLTPASPLNTAITLYRQDQTTVVGAVESAGGTGSDARLIRELTATETYYAKVTAEAGTVGHFEFGWLIKRRPAAPTGFNAVAASGTSVQLTWTDNANNANGDQETSYRVERCAGSGAGCTPFVELAPPLAVDATGFLDTGLTAGQAYTYKVFAKNASGDSPKAGPLTVSLIGPTAPTGLTATTISGTQIDLAWTDASNNETAFEIQSCSGAACSNFTLLTTVGAGVQAYSHTVSVDGSYSYQVRAINNVGNSTFAGSVTANTIRPAAPTAPSATTISATQINLAWTGNSNNETGFQVERCAGQNCSSGFTIINTTGVDAVAYNDVAAAAQTYYGYRIAAKNIAGLSAYTAIVYANTRTPGAPASFAAAIFSSTRVDLSWVDTSAAETGFVVERCVNIGCSGFGQLVSLAAGTTAYSDNTVTQGNTYRYRVHATGVAGNSADVGPLDVGVLLPAPPVSLTATTISTTQVNLAWSDVSDNETTFRIERCIGAACTFTPITSEIANVTAGTAAYSDVSVTQGNEYHYRVRAQNAVGYSAYTNVAVTSTALPATPTSLTSSTASATQIDLLWVDNAGNEDGYRVERCANAACPTFSLLTTLPPDATSFSNTVSAGNSFTYRVYAYNLAGNSPFSNTTTSTTSVPFTPTGLVATATSATSIQLLWDDVVNDETGFTIFRCAGVGCTPTLPYDVAPKDADGYNDVSAIADTYYAYRISAFNVIGTSGLSNVAAVTTSAPGPLASLTAVTISGTRIDLTWTDTTTNTTGIGVERCLGNGCTNFTGFTAAAPGSQTLIDPTVLVDNEYRYRVFAMNNVGNGAFTEVDANTLRPATPTSIVATTNSPTQITLTWDNNANNELGYKVERCIGGGCVNFAVVSTLPVDATDYIDTNVSADNVYRYRVYGYNIAGNSDLPAPVTASTFVPPAPTSLVATTQSDSQIDLAWTDNASDEVGYLIERCEGAGCLNFTQVDSIGVDAQAYQSTGLNPNSEYTFRVRAVNTSGTGNYSNSASAATNLPGAPSALKSTVLSLSAVQLDWTDNASFPNAELGFSVERCDGAGCSSFAEITTAAANATQLVDGTVAASTTYRYRVRAYNAVGASTYSNEITVSTTVPVAPSVLIAFGSSPTTVTLQWSDDSDNETSFQIERCTNIGCSSFALIATISVADSTGYINTGLTAETNYRYRVRALNTLGASAYGPVTDANTKLPVAPSALSAAATSSTVVGMTWNDNALDEISYSVERCQGAACSSFVQIVSLPLNSTSYTNVGLTPNSVYRYRVRAVSAVGAGPYSNIDDAPTDIPIDPNTLTALAMAATEIDINWVDASNNETGFIIERCTGVGCSGFSILQLVGANVTSYADPSVDPDQAYSYRVQAVKTGVGASGFSNIASAVTSIPGDPVNLFASTVNGSRIDLAWDDNATNELAMQLERCTGAGCSSFTLLTTLPADATSYSDQAVGINTTYRYRVQATNNVGPSGYSNEATANTLQPNLTSGLSATTVSGTQIDLQWVDASTNETYFLLERCTGLACSTFARLDSLGVGTTTFQDVSVVVGNVYRYQVAAYNNSGTAGYDGPAQATTLLPADPTSLTAMTITASRIDLTWGDLADNEDGYSVERCNGIGCASFVPVISLPAGTTAYSNTGLTINTFYTYRVRALNAAGTSQYSDPVDANTFFPAAPNALVAKTVLADRIDLTWNDNSNNETGFEIERCDAAACSNFVNIGSVGVEVEAYTDLTTVIGQTYRYRVRAVNGVGASGYTLVATALTTGVPADPSGANAVTTSASTIQLTWTDNSSNEIRFRIERCTGFVCGNFQPHDSVSAGVTTYNDLGLAPTERYSYRVRAVNVGSSGTSNVATATTILPDAPTGLTAIGVSGTRADLAWTDNADNEYGFQIERCTGAGCSNFAQIATVGADVSEYADNTLSSNNTYEYRVRANNGAGVSGYTNTSAAVTNVPSIPTGLTATTISATQIDLAWTDNATTENRYRIERCAGIGCTNFLPIDSTAADVQVFSDVGLATGTIFRYRVRAANASGPSGYSNVATAGTNVPADPTTLVAVTVANFQVDLTWVDNADNELGYIVERCDLVACSNFVQVAALPADATAYSDNSLSIGNDYRFRVRADNNAGSSNYSNVADGSTRTPASPTNLVATTVSSTRIDLTWTDNSDNELTFRVERCQGGGCSSFSEIAQLPPGTQAYSNEGLTANQSYTYQIIANNVSGWSGYSSQETATTNFPATPTNLTATTISATQINLAWNDNANNETGYKIYRCDNAGCGGDIYVEIFTTGANATTFNDLSVTLGNTYGYWIQAFNVAGFSPEATTNGSTLAPVEPTITLSELFDATPTTRILWTDNANNELSFRVERCTGVGCNSFVEIQNLVADANGTLDVGVPGGDVLRYRVRTQNAAAFSNYTNIVDILVTVPAAAGSLTATTLGESQIQLDWTDAATNELGYRIDRCVGSACSDFVEIGSTGPDVQSFVAGGLTIGTVYTFRVRSYNVLGDGTASNSAEANTLLPDDPTSLTATTVAPGQIDLAWTDKAGNEETYRIERCSGAGCSSFVEIASLGADAESYSNTGVSLNGVYRYRVRALNVVGASAYTNEDQANTLLPTAPTGLIATSVTGDRIDLAWNDSNFETSYDIEACVGGGCSSFSVVATTGTNVASIQLTPIGFGQDYSFRVRGQNISGPSAYSNESTGSTVLVAPANVRATTLNRNQIRIDWTDNTGIETSYRVERCTGIGCVSYVLVAVLPVNTQTFTNGGLPAGAFFTYRVRAMTDGGNVQSALGSSAMTPVPVASPNNTPLVSDTARSERHWVISVPAGTRQLVVKQTTGSGDPDMYVKFGSVPVAYDVLNDPQNCVPYTGGNPEYCVINDPTPGDWFIMSQGFSPYTNLTLDISLPGDVVLVNDANWLNQAMPPDNQQWARNMVNFTGGGPRASGNVVYIDRGRATPATPVSWPLTDFINVFNSQGYGVGQIFTSSGTLTAGTVPGNVKLLVLFVPVTPYTGAEIDFVRQFVRQGGRILYVGEYNGFLTAQGVASLNQFVAAFGSSTVHKNDAIYTQPFGVVTPDQIMNGVGSINFGLTNAFIASPFDKVLNTGSDGQAFMVLLRPTWLW